MLVLYLLLAIVRWSHRVSSMHTMDGKAWKVIASNGAWEQPVLCLESVGAKKLICVITSTIVRWHYSTVLQYLSVVGDCGSLCSL